jgi:general secretion pathway protein D
MKNLYIILALFFSQLSFAAPPAITPPLAIPPLPVLAPALVMPPQSVDISAPYGISLVEFTRQILQDVLKAQFVFSDDFINAGDRVGFSRTGVGRSGSKSLLKDVLSERGYSLIEKNGYYQVTKSKPLPGEEKSEFIYRPKYRDLSYLSSILSPIFSRGSFSFQRGVESPAAASGSKSDASVTISGDGGGKRPVENGTSALSQVSRSDLDVFIYSGTRKEIEKLSNLLEQIDTPVPRALVRAFVLEVGRGDNDASALSLVAGALSSKLSITVSSGASLGNALSFSTPDFNAVFSALSSDSRFTVQTSPALFANTGVRASLKVGSKVPTLGAIQTLQGGQTQQSVTYQEVGTLLSVTPVISAEHISVTVEQELSDAIQTVTGLSSTPTLNTRSISTTLSLASGDWVMLGGLRANKNATSATRFPFFGFPLGKSNSVSDSDIVVLLQVVRQ